MMQNRFSVKSTYWLGLIAAAFSLLIVACGGNDEPPPPPADSVSNSAVKILVDEAGLHRLTVGQLQDGGLAVDSIDAQNVALFSGGEAIPYAILDGDLVFYGEASDSRYSLTRPYIVRSGVAGILMSEADAAAADGETIASVNQTVKLEENVVYEQRAAEYDGDVWFWSKIVNTGDTAKSDFEIELLSAPSGSAEISLQLWGFTFNNDIDPDHDFELLINGTSIGEVTFDGSIYYTSTTPIEEGLLTEGTNTITIDNSKPGAALLDQMFLNWIQLDYEAATTAVGNRLDVTEGAGNIVIGGFSSEPLAVDVTDSANPVLLTNWQFEDGKAQFSKSADMAVAVAAEDGFLSVDSVGPVIETTLRDSTNQADLLIVTTRELAPALDDLVTAREAQGLTVNVALIDEIYDEFGYGLTSPYAIQDYVSYAYNNWAKPEPQYLFLVGDATTDLLGYRADDPDNPIEPPRNIVPSVMVDVSFSGETVSDARLADVDGDFAPDLAVGRWPVDSQREVENLVERTLAYENGNSSENALFTYDGTGGSEFSNFTDRLIETAQFPENSAILFAGPATEEEAENGNVPDEIAAQWNDGAWLVSYVGHGSLELWGKHELLSIDSVGSLGSADTAPPIVLQFSCLTGHFAEPTAESISETMLKHESGPVLLVAATSLTLSSNQSPFALKLTESLLDPSVRRMGDALQLAKAELQIDGNPGLLEISDTFGLIGDPSALIVRPDTIATATR